MDMSERAPVGAIDRKTYIGGSDIAAILGVDPYERTPLTVYLQKIGELQGITDPDTLRFLRRRKRWEEPIVAMLREEYDGEIVAVNQRYPDKDVPFFAAEIDFEPRIAGVMQNGEIKTVSPFAFGERYGWGDAGTDEIPIHYHAQVQWGLGVTGRERCVVCAMSGLDNMVFYQVERDDETIANMRAAAERFWRHNVEKRVPPDPLTMADFAHLFSGKRGKPVELDEETANAVRDLRLVRETIRAHQADEEALQIKIASFVAKTWGLDSSDAKKDNAALLFNGEPICTWAAGRGAHLDQKRLAEEHPEIKAAYTVPHYFRTFRFKKSTKE